MFELIQKQEGRCVDIVLNDQQITVPAEINVAAAMLLHSPDCRVTVVSASARGPFCMMGACFDCLVEINGIANQQACMQQVEEGMRVNFQKGAVEITQDVIS